MDKKRKTQAKEHLTPEEILLKRQRATWRFRAAIRFVMKNIYWLEDVEDRELGDDIRKNVALLLTRRKEKKSLLTLQDKAVLNKPAELRTDEEKIHLGRVIGGLRCFRRYPTNVKNQLAGVTYFYYYGPGRVIVRQGDISHNLYFIVTGEVIVSQAVYDPILEEMVNQDIAVMGAGSMFGEVALMEDIPRTATITTKAHVEVLCLKRNDFNIVLKATIKQQWEDIRIAMSRFTYFEDWNDTTIRECCILAKMKAYPPGHTVFGDGVGLRDYVYFILRGTCRVIEHLLISKNVIYGKSYYKRYFSPKDEPFGNTNGAVNQDDEKTGTEETVSNAGTTKSDDTQLDRKSSQASMPNVLNLSTRPAPKISDINLPKNVKMHFMQVCFLNRTACFDLGENLQHRRVVAMTHTECLLIPRYWLVQKNKGNIWNRVKQFLDKHIPSSDDVYREFVNQRKWLDYRKQLAKEVLSRRKISNDNSFTNVPYFIRIHEQIDLP